MLLGIFEHVAHPCGADADEHLDEIGAGNGEKRHLRFASNALGQQGLAGTGRADQQHPARDAPAEFLEFLRILEEVDQFLDVLLGFVAPGDVGKSDGVGRFIEHAGTRLAKAERTAASAALHLAHEVHPDADQQQHGEPGNEDLREEGLLLARRTDDVHTVLDQIAHHPQVPRRSQVETSPFTRRHVENTALVNDDLLDAPCLGVLHELGIAHCLGGLRTVELLEHREQHETDHEPDRNLGKPLIIQTNLPKTGHEYVLDMQPILGKSRERRANRRKPIH
ncbi:hypothetical protein GALL_454250 [mine drainage metagenome]|uniref:Uncharacterized protein n=1 Tax=mine drainage metagenome TaxID=410659 RepID=A0A1J5QAE3_9ZZZZ